MHQDALRLHLFGTVSLDMSTPMKRNTLLWYDLVVYMRLVEHILPLGAVIRFFGTGYRSEVQAGPNHHHRFFTSARA